MKIQKVLAVILRMEAIGATHSEDSTLCCPKIDIAILTKSCAVCEQALASFLNTKPAPFRIRAACSTLARHQCCKKIKLENPEKLRVSLKRVSMLKAHVFKNLHLI